MIQSENQLLLKEHPNGETVLACSYSQIEMYLQCPYKWHHTYIDGFRSKEPQEALELGSKIHKLCEDILTDQSNGVTWELAQLENRWDEDINSGDIPFASEETKQLAYEQNLETFRAIVDTGSELQKQIAGQDIIGIEKQFWFPFALQSAAYINGEYYTTVWLNGAKDLVLEDFDGTITIIDHKSGKKVFDKKKLATNLQFPIYVLSELCESNEDMAFKCFYHFTRLNRLQEVDITLERIESAITELTAVFHGMYNRKSHPKCCSPLCPYCEFSKGDCSKGVKLLSLPKEEQKKMWEW